MLCYFSDQNFTVVTSTLEKIEKVVYVLVFQQGSFLLDRVHKICESFCGKIYDLPESDQGNLQTYINMIQELKQSLTRTKSLIKITRE